MYSLLVVDDEELERNAIRHIIHKSCPMIGEVLEAANGIEALAVYRERMPDIVFCDIKMPGKNGLELAREIKEIKSSQCLVFLTAYDYFDYAREAISLKVDDYLLKPADNTRLVTLIETLTQRLDGQNEQQKIAEDKDKRLELLTDFFRNEYLAALLEQGTSSASLFDYHSMLLSNPEECIVAATRIDFSRFPLAINDSGQRELLRNRALSLLKNEIEIRLYSFLVHEQDSLVYFLLYPLAEEKSQYTSEGAMYDLFTSIGQIVEKRLSISLVTALSNAPNDPESIHKAFIHVKELLDKGESSEENLVALPAGDMSCADNTGLTPRLVALLEQVTEKIEHEYMTLLTLEDAASSINLSSFYFSKVFKQFRGITFIDALNEVRIKHARILLRDPKIAIKTIAQSTGYSDSNYFSRVFKNSCGDTPSEYRNKIMR